MAAPSTTDPQPAPTNNTNNTAPPPQLTLELTRPAVSNIYVAYFVNGVRRSDELIRGLGMVPWEPSPPQPIVEQPVVPKSPSSDGGVPLPKNSTPDHSDDPGCHPVAETSVKRSKTPSPVSTLPSPGIRRPETPRTTPPQALVTEPASESSGQPGVEAAEPANTSWRQPRNTQEGTNFASVEGQQERISPDRRNERRNRGSAEISNIATTNPSRLNEQNVQCGPQERPSTADYHSRELQAHKRFFRNRGMQAEFLQQQPQQQQQQQHQHQHQQPHQQYHQHQQHHQHQHYHQHQQQQQSSSSGNLNPTAYNQMQREMRLEMERQNGKGKPAPGRCGMGERGGRGGYGWRRGHRGNI